MTESPLNTEPNMRLFAIKQAVVRWHRTNMNITI